MRQTPNNITWSANWSKKSVSITEEKEKLSAEDRALLKKQLNKFCEELVINSNKIYEMNPDKDLYDAIVMIESARKSLIKIFQRNE